MNRLAIIGSGDLGQQIAHHAIATGKFSVIGFFDDFAKKGETITNHVVLGNTEDVENYYKRGNFDCLMIGIGYKHMRLRCDLYVRFKESNIPFATIVHPSCIVDKNVVIGEGTVIYPGCILDSGVRIGENVLLNVGCCIAHDTTIASHSFLSPRVAIAGFTCIGERNILGINCTIIDNITTVDAVQIGGGGLVIKDVANSGLYVGAPVKFVR